ncbi:hypothetical protein LCGC14_1254960 [marine sediment metagenome]|uniref:HNH nuclease domain-containing protein n=1 Tax=marine sediment metagenome TaxID=412755 RepID=A0A0F9L2F2_9ZZZZ
MKYHKHTRELLEPVIRDSISFSDALRKLGRKPVGGSITSLKLTCKRNGIDTSHMTGQGHRKGKQPNNRLSANEILIMGASTDRRTTAHLLRRALFEIGVEHVCVECDLKPEWKGKSITLEVDHKDGQYWNNLQENLQFLCPNCHSQR